MIQPEIEPRFPGPLANTLTIMPLSSTSFDCVIRNKILDSGCHLDDLARVIADKEGWCESQGNQPCQYTLILGLEENYLLEWYSNRK